MEFPFPIFLMQVLFQMSFVDFGISDKYLKNDLNPHFSQGFLARRRKRMWMKGLRPKTPEAYLKYVEESEGA